MQTWPKALCVAFIFLTRLPMPTLSSIEPEDEGRSLLCFPLVGLAIGLLLSLLMLLLNPVMPPLILAAILTTVWAAITGGLHLDGLADSADGWLGGLGDVDKTLQIMHDSRCGSGALVAVVCVLLCKFTALTLLIEQQLWLPLLIAPIISRCFSPLLFVRGGYPYLPYVQATGIAKNFIDHCPSYARAISWLCIACCLLALHNIYSQLWVVATVAISVHCLRRLMLVRLRGATGDTAGATTEIVETVILLACGVAATSSL